MATNQFTSNQYNNMVSYEIMERIKDELINERHSKLFSMHIVTNQIGVLKSYMMYNATLTENEAEYLIDILFQSVQDGIVSAKITLAEINAPDYWLKCAEQLIENHEKITKGNFELSKYVFEQMLSELRQGNEQLFERTFVLHYEKCVTWLQREYPKANIDDLVDATIDANIEFRRKLIEGKIKYGNMEFLFTLMAKQHYQRMLQKQKIFTLVDYYTHPIIVADIDYPEIDDQMIINAEKALQELCEQCRTLLTKYIIEGRRLVDMIKEFGYKDKNGINKRKYDCLQKLRQHFYALAKN